MKKLDVSSTLEEKIYDAKFPIGGKKGKITSYFSLTPSEKQEIWDALRESNILVEVSPFSQMLFRTLIGIQLKSKLKKNFRMN
ncbi:MAG: hypothetical protein ACE5RI_05740 [Candidatus Nitrosomaritimum yanchengensis]